MNYRINPITKRRICVGGKVYQKLVAQKIINERDPVAIVFSTPDLMNLIMSYHIDKPLVHFTGQCAPLLNFYEINARLVCKRWRYYFDKLVKEPDHSPYFCAKLITTISDKEKLISKFGAEVFFRGLALVPIMMDLLDPNIFRKYEGAITRVFLEPSIALELWNILGSKTRNYWHFTGMVHNLDNGKVNNGLREKLNYIYNVNGIYYGSTHPVLKETIRALLK